MRCSATSRITRWRTTTAMSFYPDVNVVEEMADMMSASRSFETNVDVLNSVKSMQQSLLRLGEV